MKKNKKLGILLIGIGIAVITFILFFIGTKYILDNPLEVKNIIAFLVLSVIVGGISSALLFIKPPVSFSLFMAGLIIGFALMFNMYNKGMDGWGDLAGLMTFFMFAIGGLIFGLIVQLIVHLTKKSQSNKNNTN